MENYKNNIIQYEENIFYLKLLINNIRKINLLNINRELFQKKIKEELIFINKTSNILFEHLLSNKKLITKDEQLHSILDLKNLYINELRKLIDANYIKKNDFTDIIINSKKDISVIEDVLNKINKDMNKEDLTTNEELNILFMEDLSTEEE